MTKNYEIIEGWDVNNTKHKNHKVDDNEILSTYIKDSKNTK